MHGPTPMVAPPAASAAPRFPLRFVSSASLSPAPALGSAPAPAADARPLPALRPPRRRTADSPTPGAPAAHRPRPAPGHRSRTAAEDLGVRRTSRRHGLPY